MDAADYSLQQRMQRGRSAWRPRRDRLCALWRIARSGELPVSIRAIRWAWQARAATAKLVLLALADMADEAGYCFPSHDHLAHKCEVSESTVRRMLNMLASRKLLRIEPRFNQNGSCISNSYRLTIDDHPVNLEGACSI